jgi:hypothetical protein
MDIHEYLDRHKRALERNQAIVSMDPVTLQAFDDFRGLFRARIYFWDGSYLTIDEVIDTEPGFPEVLRYSYTYIGRDGQHVFRYDNAPHYPQLATFPHHRHRGAHEIPEASKQPNLNRVLREIKRILADAQ